MTLMENNKLCAGWTRSFLATVSMTVLLASGMAHAAVSGVQGPGFTLSAEVGYISVADGGSIYSWGYTNTGTMQLPGPTLIVTEGDMVTVELSNNLPAAAGNTSIVFPGQREVAATGGVKGDLAQEAQTGGSVTYTFEAGPPGTYQYHSGTQPDLQVEMGLYGALIVRPSDYTLTGSENCTNPVIATGGKAFNHVDTCYDREYLYVLSEIDIHIHQAAEAQASGPGPIVLPAGAYHSEYWLMNGRAGPDSMAGNGTEILPYQPYGSLTRMHPGERLLVRVVGAGREMHPFHTHGNHVRLLARDGRMLLTDTNDLAGPLLFTIPSLPGGTADGIFTWTGKELGWDMYDASTAHNCIDVVNNTTGVAPKDGYADSASDYPWEWCADHGQPIPVTLPSLSSLAFGGFYGGSPYLGAMGSLPPGEGGLNPYAGFAYMWHSHTERELVNFDVFPGGMLTMLIVEGPGTTIIE
ncbi:MAG: multicopper oxidase domain-containing protein [Woeseiaceae bacterium]